jgi:hypothetical protein
MRIRVNDNQIEYETDKAYLIKMPNSNKKFWFPKSLSSYIGRHFVLQLFDDMKITIFDKSSSKKVNARYLEDYFTNINDECYLRVEEPKKLDKEVKIPDELRNDSTAERSDGKVRKN